MTFFSPTVRCVSMIAFKNIYNNIPYTNTGQKISGELLPPGGALDSICTL